MYSGKSEQKFSSGTIAFEVKVEGKIDQPESLVDAMLATAGTVINAKGFIHGVTTNGHHEESRSASSHKCSSTIEFDGITLTTEIKFDLDYPTSLRALNSLVLSEILPQVWETAGNYLGVEQSLAPPILARPSGFSHIERSSLAQRESALVGAR